MKNFLVDRIRMYTAYISGLGGKYFVGVSTCGGIGAKTVAKNMAKHFITGFQKGVICPVIVPSCFFLFSYTIFRMTICL